MTPAVGLLASFAWILGLGLLASRIARSTGIPDLVFYVLIGVVLGPQALGLVHLPATGNVGELIVTGGAVFMLYEGGRAINVGVLRRIWLGTGLLATLGVLLTAAVVALTAHYVANLSWAVSALAGAAMASTDPATIVPLFAQVRVKQRVQQLVISESAFNDATGAVTTMTVLAVVTGSHLGALQIGGTFVQMVLVGIAVGLGVGFAAQLLDAEGHRLSLFTQQEENAVLTLFAMLAAYILASVLGGSGFMAVFIAGIIRGNAATWGLAVDTIRAESHETFLTLLGMAVRMLIFAVLGANVDLHLLGTLGVAGLVVVAALVFVGRPLTVFACLGLDRVSRWSKREMLFTSWVRETGVVPAALASLLLAEKAPGADKVAALIFLAVLVTILLQGPTTAAWARRMGLAEPEQHSHAGPRRGRRHD